MQLRTSQIRKTRRQGGGLVILVCFALRNDWMLCEPEALHQFFVYVPHADFMRNKHWHLRSSSLLSCSAWLLGWFPTALSIYRNVHCAVNIQSNFMPYISVIISILAIWIQTLGVIRLDSSWHFLVLPFRKVWTHVNILTRLCRRWN